MPELPEVERAAGIVRDAALGKEIVRVRALHPAVARHLSPEVAASLHGRTIERVDRRGKHQLLVLDDGRVLDVHFRLNGDWRIARAGDPLDRFARAAIDLDDGTRIELVDSRALSTIRVHAAGTAPLPALGPEPSAPAFTAEHLGRALARRRGPIKPALLDQKLVAGLGNIYAAEALWEAGIAPTASAASLGRVRRERLVQAIRAVLAAAPAARYSVEPERTDWRVYGREGEPCARCGAPIARIVQAGRSSFYCPRCQRR